MAHLSSEDLKSGFGITRFVSLNKLLLLPQVLKQGYVCILGSCRMYMIDATKLKGATEMEGTDA